MLRARLAIVQLSALGPAAPHPLSYHYVSIRPQYSTSRVALKLLLSLPRRRQWHRFWPTVPRPQRLPVPHGKSNGISEQDLHRRNAGRLLRRHRWPGLARCCGRLGVEHVGGRRCQHLGRRPPPGHLPHLLEPSKGHVAVSCAAGTAPAASACFFSLLKSQRMGCSAAWLRHSLVRAHPCHPTPAQVPGDDGRREAARVHRHALGAARPHRPDRGARHAATLLARTHQPCQTVQKTVAAFTFCTRADSPPPLARLLACRVGGDFEKRWNGQHRPGRARRLLPALP